MSEQRAERYANVADADLSDRTVLVTGATDGIGRETALALGRLGAHVLVHGRNEEKGSQVIDALEETAGSGRFYAADFETQRAVTDLADEIRADCDGLDALVNNAGGWFSDGQLTEDDVERTFAVNCLAAYRLTYELVPLLRERDGRVVTVSSEAHRSGTMDFPAIRTIGDYGARRAYNRSKLANVLFTRELARRLDDADVSVTATCLHPGVVPWTGFWRDASAPIRLLTTVLGALPEPATRPFFDDEAKAAATATYLVAGEAENVDNGDYVVDCEPREPSAEARDSRTARRLWEMSAEIAGIDPAFGLHRHGATIEQ